MWTKNFNALLCDTYGANGKYLSSYTPTGQTIGDTPLVVKDSSGTLRVLGHAGNSYNTINIWNNARADNGNSANTHVATLEFQNGAYLGQSSYVRSLLVAVGHGPGNVVYDKYNLDTAYANNNFTITFTSNSTYNSTNRKFTKNLNFSVVNATSSPIEITEIGLFANIVDGSGTIRTVMIYYDALMEAITLPAGGILRTHISQDYTMQEDYT